MAFARVTIVQLKDPGIGDVLERVGQEMAPVFSQQPGFVAYYGVKTTEDSGLTVSVWETQDEADQSAATAGAWIRENLANRVASAHHHVGVVIFAAPRGAAATP